MDKSAQEEMRMQIDIHTDTRTHNGYSKEYGKKETALHVARCLACCYHFTILFVLPDKNKKINAIYSPAKIHSRRQHTHTAI